MLEQTDLTILEWEEGNITLYIQYRHFCLIGISIFFVILLLRYCFNTQFFKAIATMKTRSGTIPVKKMVINTLLLWFCCILPKVGDYTRQPGTHQNPYHQLLIPGIGTLGSSAKAMVVQ